MYEIARNLAMMHELCRSYVIEFLDFFAIGQVFIKCPRPRKGNCLSIYQSTTNINDNNTNVLFILQGAESLMNAFSLGSKSDDSRSPYRFGIVYEAS